MANIQSKYASGLKPMPEAVGAEVVAVRMEVDAPVTLALNDVLEFGDLPPDHVPVDCILDSADLDTNGAPTITIDVGLLNAGKTAISVVAADGGAKWITAATVAQAGGIVRPTTRALNLVTPDAATSRMVGAVISAVAATKAAGKVALTLLYRAGHYGQ